jgi:hypothetical protein
MVRRPTESRAFWLCPAAGMGTAWFDTLVPIPDTEYPDFYPIGIHTQLAIKAGCVCPAAVVRNAPLHTHSSSAATMNTSLYAWRHPHITCEKLTQEEGRVGWGGVG